MSDPAKYRTRQELDEHKKRDALTRLRNELLKKKEFASRVAEAETSVEEEIADAVTFAEQSPEPEADVLEPTTYNGAFAR